MDSRLRSLLVAILHRCGSLPRTNLVKLVYLVDWEYAKRYGQTYTGLRYLFHHFGPFAMEIVEAASDYEYGFAVMPHHSQHGRTSYIHGLSDHTLSDRTSLPSEVWYTIDIVLERVPYHDLEGLLDHVYSTDPMHTARRGEVLDMTKGPESDSRNRLEKLRKLAEQRRRMKHTAGMAKGDAEHLDRSARELMGQQVLSDGNEETND